MLCRDCGIPLLFAAWGAALKLLLVCGPFGSGTTVVAGLLNRLGGAGLVPTWRVNDLRTGDTHEAVPFRDLVLKLTSEQTLGLLPGAKEIAETELIGFRERVRNEEFGPYDPQRPLFLKHPMSAFLIEPLCKVFDTRLIYVIRPFKDIEATRERRRWPVQYGSKGAERIYSELFRLLVVGEFPTLIVRYRELLADALAQAQSLATFSGLTSDAETVEKAAAFIRPR